MEAMATAVGVLKFVGGIGLAILVHEFGHFIAARMAGIKVLKFSIGLPPRLFGFKRGETEYVIQALPVGGYVKLAGEDWEDGRAPRKHELMAKPWHVRIGVYSAGVIMNALLAYLLFFAHLVRGVEFGSPGTTLGRMQAGTPAVAAGLRSGDRITAVAAAPVANWYELGLALDKVKPDESVDLTVRRDGADRTVRLRVTADTGLAPAPPRAVIGEVTSMSPARKAGLLAGDRIVSIGGKPVRTWTEISPLFARTGEKPVLVTIRRDGKKLDIEVTPKIDPREQRPIIGIGPAFEFTVTRRFGIGEGLTGAAVQIWSIALEIPKAFAMVITGKAKLREIVGGPVLITRIGVEKAKAGFWELVYFIAIINVQLLVFNLLPLPILDGGMIFLAILERIRRKQFSVKTYERLTMVGAGLLISLMLYATFHDVQR